MYPREGTRGDTPSSARRVRATDAPKHTSRATVERTTSAAAEDRPLRPPRETDRGVAERTDVCC